MILIRIFRLKMLKLLAPAKNFCNWPVFTSLSRLTYGIYLCHLTIVRPLLGQQINLPYLSFSSLVSYLIYIIFFIKIRWKNKFISNYSKHVQMLALAVLCHIVALILCLSLEFPLTAVAKKLLRKEYKGNKFKL